MSLSPDYPTLAEDYGVSRDVAAREKSYRCERHGNKP